MKAIAQIDEGVEILLELAGRHLAGETVESVDALRDDYVERRDQNLPQVMLFGAYNAGKSSLVNALVGSEIAPYSDVPKTFKRQTYRCDDCVLIDTPGVNAPIEHEEVTEAEIKRSELILLVVRQGDLDALDVYERLFDLLVQEKKLFIVFNHESSAESVPSLIVHLNDILHREAYRRNIDLEEVSDIHVYPVNIATANRARLADKQELLRHSGLLDFEQGFHSWLAGFDDEVHYVDHVRRYVQQRLIEPLADTLGAADSAETKEKKNKLEVEQQSKMDWYMMRRKEINALIRWKINDKKTKIRSVLEESRSVEDVRPKINGIYKSVYEEVAKSKQLEVFNEKIREIESSEPPDLAANYVGHERDANPSQLSGLFLNGLKTVDEAKLFGVLDRLKEVGLPLVKDLAEDTLKTFAKRANIVLNVAFTGIDAIRAGQRQEQENDKRRQKEMAMHQAVEAVSQDFEKALRDAVYRVVDALEWKEVAEIDAKKEELFKNEETMAADREVFEKARVMITRAKVH